MRASREMRWNARVPIRSTNDGGGPNQAHGSRVARAFGGLRTLFRLEKWAAPDVLLVAGMVAYSLFFTIYLTQKYADFRTGYFDFGLGVQSTWLVSKGLLNGLALGRPITILAGIIYAAYPHPETLLAIQSYALCMGALPVYLLAKRVLGNSWHAAVFSLLYLASPALWGVNQYEFHDLAFSVPFLLFSGYFYSVQKEIPFLASLTLALCSSPFVVIIALVIALSFLIDARYGDDRKGSLKFAVITFVASLAFVAYLQLVPLLPVFQLSTVGSQSYTFLGSTAYVNPLAALSDPLGSVSYAWPLKTMYFLSVLGPTLFLPFLRMNRFLPSIPWVAIVIVYTPSLGAGGVGSPYEFSQWSSFLIPFLFIGAIYGLHRVQLKGKCGVERVNPRRLLILMVICTIVVGTLLSGLSPIGQSTQFSGGDSSVPTDISPGAWYHGIWPTPVRDSLVLDWFVSQIPVNYSVLTQNQIGSKLGERLAPVYIFYQPGYKNVFADAILVDGNLDGLCTACLNNILLSGKYITYLSYAQGGISLYYRTGS